MLKKILLIIIILILVVGGGVLLWAANLKLPVFDITGDRLVAESTKIYDRTGEVLLYSAEGKIKRRVVSSDQISRYLKNATVAIEDDQFYQHNGVKLGAMIRAFFANLAGGHQGGSTITQQLIKNSLLTQDRTISRKVKEIFLAMKLERVVGKDEILAWYLNEVPYGGLIYGADEASRTFFGHSPEELTLAEAAYLAAIPNAPTYYSPYGNNLEALEERKNLVLGRMLALNFITEEEYTETKNTEVKFQPRADANIRAPHFVMWVLGELEKKYGQETVRNRGFKVVTTLDWKLQEAAEAAVAAYSESNKTNFNASNAGMVAIDPTNGQILTMVGSRDYFDSANEGNFNVTLAHRQPGSAFKPFVYAEAINKGFTSETVVFDLPTQFDTGCTINASHCYAPSNYDNKFRGPMTLRSALAQSINVPSVKVLYLAGITDSIQLARQMGIQELSNSSQYGLSLVLGGGEVSLLDMTSAYGVFANDGVRYPAQNILQVENGQGNVLESFETREQRVLPAETARVISDILSDNAARTPIFGANSIISFPNHQVAVKTGTTNDYRDAWVLGYTPNIVVGAWVGNNDNSPMQKKVAGLIVTPMWRRFFEKAIVDRPNQNFATPEPLPDDLPPYKRGVWEGGQSYFIDKISGKLATEYTPPSLREEKTLKQVHSILYWLGRQNDPQFNLWETPVRNWAAGHGLFDETGGSIPTETDDVHHPEFAPKINVAVSQLPTTQGLLEINVEVIVREAKFPLKQVDFFWNDHFLGSSRQAPFRWLIKPQDVGSASGETNDLRVVAYDTVSNQTTQTTTVQTGN